MADPRRLFLPFIAVAAATAFAAVDRTSASFFPPSVSIWPIDPPDLDRFGAGSSDALVRQLSRAERVKGLSLWIGPERFEEIGQASWYGSLHQGRVTASGERFDMNKLTAAHRSLPLGTSVRVTNLDNGRSIDVTINDRGPYVGTRVIDLSREAARELHMEREGVAPVRIEELRAEAATGESVSGIAE